MISRPLPMLGSNCEGGKDSKMVVCKRRESWQNSVGEMIQMVWVRQYGMGDMMWMVCMRVGRTHQQGGGMHGQTRGVGGWAGGICEQDIWMGRSMGG